MVLLPSSDSYLEQSSLLIAAHPTTTRITTHYSLPRPKTRKPPTTTRSLARGNSKPNNTLEPVAAPAAVPPPSSSQVTPIAILTLKTYDPVSGVVLKYRTNRAAEVGRLMAALGRLAEVMSSGRSLGLEGEDRSAAAEEVVAVVGKVETAGVGGGGGGSGGSGVGSGGQQQQQQQQGGKKGKKKGKR